jgi:putative DNA-invertase from lambdoid prophage Rac
MRIPEQIVSLSTGPGFIRLLDRLEAEDVLIVTKLDRLGRNAIDVASMVYRLEAMGVRVGIQEILVLGG